MKLTHRWPIVGIICILLFAALLLDCSALRLTHSTSQPCEKAPGYSYQGKVDPSLLFDESVWTIVSAQRVGDTGLLIFFTATDVNAVPRHMVALVEISKRVLIRYAYYDNGFKDFEFNEETKTYEMLKNLDKKTIRVLRIYWQMVFKEYVVLEK